MQPFPCGRIHLQRRIEDEEQCPLLVRELQGLIRLVFPEHLHDREVLQEDYIRRVLHLRKVKQRGTLNIVTLNDCQEMTVSQSVVQSVSQKMLKWFIISD